MRASRSRIGAATIPLPALLLLCAAQVLFAQSQIYTNRLAIGNAIESDNSQELALIASHGGNLEEQNLFGLTPLMEAAQAAAPRCAELLIAQGVNLNSRSLAGFPAVYYAVYVNPADPEQNDPTYLPRRAQVLTALIQAGAHFKEVFWKSRGYTLVHIAAESGNLPCLKVLADSGADLNAGGVWGETPLMTAAREGDPAVVRYLVEAGADTSAETVGGQNALDYAAEWPKVADYLRSIGMKPGSYRQMLDSAFGSGG
ncbi:ankyrin repeat domain-containing protein [Salinispira pacifica]